ncbi:MAG: SDR family oxidoreductase, partial [Oscillospiraceae bacterium]|nr:SDR family oxidoreductase [Oscillospiraceae bacterium]
MGNHLEGRVAIVTGSGQGIGRAVAKALAAEGASVVTNNRAPITGHNPLNQLDDEKLSRMTEQMREWVLREMDTYIGDAETTAAEIRAGGGEATACFADITDFNDAKRLVNTALDVYGQADIVVNVAGAFGFAPFDKISKELWDKVNAVKPTGYFYVLRHAVPHMKKRKWGRIINCTSGAFMGGPIRQAEYSAANAGVLGLTWALACELAEDGITANAFAPGAKTRASVDMEVFDKVVAEDEMSTATGVPIVTYDGTEPPERFAPFIAYLAS